MNRLENYILELNKVETRLLHNIIRYWMDSNECENEVIWACASELADELYAALKGGRDVLQ